MLKQIHLYLSRIDKKHQPELELFEDYGEFGNYCGSTRGLKGLAAQLKTIASTEELNTKKIEIRAFAPAPLEKYCSHNISYLNKKQRKEFASYLPKGWEIKWISKEKKNPENL